MPMQGKIKTEMLIKTSDGRLKDVTNLLDVNAENYIVPDNERESYHCIIEVKKFDANTGARLSRPMLQKFDAKTFMFLREQFKLQGWSIEILYDPTQYLAEKKDAQRNAQKVARDAQKEAINKAVAAALEQQAKEQQAAIDAAVAAALEKVGAAKPKKTTKKVKG